MLDGLKRLLSGSRPGGRGHADVARWAAGHGWSHHAVRGPEGGFIVDARGAEQPFRLEWGPAQRSYVTGRELRLRAESPLHRELQALVLTRPLAEVMEKTVFDQYVEGVQTRIETDTPPEMRWLVMFPKLGSAEMRALRERFVALASHKTWLRQWLDGALAAALMRAPLAEGAPMVLMLGRGRLTLRTALPDPEPEVLEHWVRVFEAALREARRLGDVGPEPSAPASTQPGLFSPGSEPPRD